jgi:hypothetical protein
MKHYWHESLYENMIVMTQLLGEVLGRCEHVPGHLPPATEDAMAYLRLWACQEFLS